MLANLSDEEKHSYRVGLYDRYFAAVPAGGTEGGTCPKMDQKWPKSSGCGLELGFFVGPKRRDMLDQHQPTIMEI